MESQVSASARFSIPWHGSYSPAASSVCCLAAAETSTGTTQHTLAS
jgi:hypothetical protein